MPNIYYRLIVSEDGEFLFRTSRLHSKAACARALQVIGDPDGVLTVEVLEVQSTESVGRKLTVEEATQLVNDGEVESLQQQG